MSAVLQMPLFTAAAPYAWASSIDIHAISIPARTFTGDFYFTRRDGDRTWFAVGDVAGKGLPAALVMAMIQEELEQRITSCARAGCDPSTTMQRLHAFLRPLLPRNRFATAVIGWLHDDGTLKLVNAGHCPPMVVRNDGRIEQIDSTGPVVGVLAKSRWTAKTLSLAPGEKLLLYSDGVIESTSPEGSEFGTSGIELVVSRLVDADSAYSLATSLVFAVDRFTGGVREDDLTVLAISRA